MNRPPRRGSYDGSSNYRGGGQGGPNQGRNQGGQGDQGDELPAPFAGLRGFVGQQQQKAERPGRYAYMIRPSRQQNVLIFICFVIFGFIWVAWTISDITGEYASSGYDREVVRLSMLRLATNVKCRLDWGTGAAMEATVNKIDTNQPLHIVFQTPQKWVSRGRKQRTVLLEGKFANSGMNPLAGSFQENEIKARLIENNEYVDVRLMRNSVASLWRQVQAHWPWAEI